MKINDNFGILTTMAWHTNHWHSDTDATDIKKSNFRYEEHHECLNFGHKIYPSEKDDFYIAYLPNFNKLPDKKNSEDVKGISKNSKI